MPPLNVFVVEYVPMPLAFFSPPQQEMLRQILWSRERERRIDVDEDIDASMVFPDWVMIPMRMETTVDITIEPTQEELEEQARAKHEMIAMRCEDAEATYCQRPLSGDCHRRFVRKCKSEFLVCERCPLCRLETNAYQVVQGETDEQLGHCVLCLESVVPGTVMFYPCCRTTMCISCGTRENLPEPK